MTKELVLLILNLVFVAFLILGFLFGLKGLKKSGIRFVCFLVGIIIALFITPIISQSIMKIQITYEGAKVSLNDLILQKINEVPDIAELTEKSPTIEKLIANFPIMIGNIFVFVVLSYVLTFLSWVVYKVFASIINKEYKEQKKQGVKVKKHRLLGGLVGAVQALLLVGITFLPVCGFVGIIRDIQNTAQAEEVVVTEKSATVKLLDENLPDEVKIIIEAYESSAIAGVGNVFGLGDKMFSSITSITVDGKKIAFRDEVINISKVYDNVEFMLDDNFDFSNWANLDIDKLINAVDYVFNSNILKTALPEFFDVYYNKLIELDEVKNDQDLLDTLTVAHEELTENDNLVNNLKEELLSVLKTIKVAKDNKILDEIPLKSDTKSTSSGGEITKENILNIFDILYKDNKKVFNEIIDNCFNSKLLNRAILYGLNKGIIETENELRDMTEDGTLTISKLDLSNKSLTVKKAEIKSLFGSVLDIANEVKDFDFDSLEDDERKLCKLKLGDIVIYAGNMMNAVQNMSVFKNSSVYNQIMDGLSKTEYNKYIDFAVLKESNIWISETNNMAKSLNKFLDSNIVDYIDLEDGKYTISNANVKNILVKLNESSLVNGEDMTTLTQILEPIYDSKMFRKVIDLGFDELSKFINDAGDYIEKDCKLGNLYLEKVHEADEKDKILAFLDNTVAYAKDLDIARLKKEIFDVIIESDLTKLGSCLDVIKDCSMFKDCLEDENSVYFNLIDALDRSKLSEYVNFKTAKEDDFMFSDEFKQVQPSVTMMNEKMISLDDGSEKTLMKYILDDGDLNVVLEQVDKQELKTIFNPLVKSRLLKPLGAMVINKINEEVKKLVGDTIGGDIKTDVNLDNLTEEEAEQVVEVIASMSDIITDVTSDDFDIATYMKDEQTSTKIEEVLTSLQDNANSGGVFEETYNSMVEYIKENDDIGQDVKDLIANNTTTGEDGKDTIDWAAVLAGLKNGTTSGEGA